jgi:hypothetical protein
MLHILACLDFQKFVTLDLEILREVGRIGPFLEAQMAVGALKIL